MERAPGKTDERRGHCRGGVSLQERGVASRRHQKSGEELEAPCAAGTGTEAENPGCCAGHHAGAPHTRLSPSAPTRRPTVPWAPQSKPKRGLNIFQNVFVPCQSPRRFCKTTFKEKRGSGGLASCLLPTR